MRARRRSLAACLLAAVVAAGCGGAATSAAPPTRTVQPGAPGEPTRDVAAAEIGQRELPPPTGADVRFMRGMIAHHAQALVMADLVPERTESEALRRLAERVEVSQRDEIRLMQSWLRRHGEEAPSVEAMLEGGMAHHHMPGMVTPEQMAALRAARGEAFERLFLELMIQHHQGALVMVDELLDSPGAAQDPTTYQLASDVVADQTAEILRMQAMLDAL